MIKYTMQGEEEYPCQLMVIIYFLVLTKNKES